MAGGIQHNAVILSFGILLCVGETMDKDEHTRKVIQAMLAMQRRAWEQGVAAQALLELGETDLVILLARDAIVPSGLRMAGWS